MKLEKEFASKIEKDVEYEKILKKENVKLQNGKMTGGCYHTFPVLIQSISVMMKMKMKKAFLHLALALTNQRACQVQLTNQRKVKDRMNRFASARSFFAISSHIIMQSIKSLKMFPKKSVLKSQSRRLTEIGMFLPAKT